MKSPSRLMATEKMGAGPAWHIGLKEDRVHMEKVAYAIKDWDLHYESAETRKLKSLPRVLVPVKHDGKGYRRIMRHPNGPAIYAAWILILQLAAKCPVRGILQDDDGPLTTEDMELKTDCPADLFDEALKVLSKPEIGWISTQVLISTSDFRRSSGPSPGTSGDAGKLSGATERNGTEGKRIKTLSVPDRGALRAPGPPSVPEKKTRTGRKPSSVFDPWFDHPEHLADLGKVREWLAWQSDQPSAVIKKPTEEDLTRVIAAANQAVSEAKNPVKMFVSIVGNGRKPKAKYYAKQA